MMSFSLFFLGALCPAGFALHDNGDDRSQHLGIKDCAECSSGRYSPPGSATCLDCPAGWKKSTTPTSSSPCFECAKGRYSERDGSISCTKCYQGRYSATVGGESSSVCLDCGAGKYGTEKGSSNESSCFLCVSLQ